MKKRFLSLLLFTIAVTGGLFAQKTFNDANAVKRDVGSFHGIHVSTGIELVLTQGDKEEVAVSASTADYRDKIVTKVENGILKIYYENKKLSLGNKKVKKSLKAYVSYKSLDQLNANTGAIVKIDGTLKAASFKMNVNTGAVVNGMVNFESLEINQNTGSIVTLTGKAGKIEADGDTGSMFKGIDLETESCDVKVSTGAGIYITVQKELMVKANTGGFLKYKGNAGIREVKTNTGGSVHKI